MTTLLTDRDIEQALKASEDPVGALSDDDVSVALGPDRGLVGEAAVGFARGGFNMLRGSAGLGKLAADALDNTIGQSAGSRFIRNYSRVQGMAAAAALQDLPRSPETSTFSARNILGTVAEGALPLAHTVAAGAATGGASLPASLAAFAGTAAAPVVGNQYLDSFKHYKGQGADDATASGQAMTEAAVAGVITAATNLPVAGVLFRGVPGFAKFFQSSAARIASGFVAGAAAESTQEVGEQVLTDAALAYARAEPVGSVFSRPEYWEQLGLTAVAAALLGGAPGAAMAVQPWVEQQTNPLQETASLPPQTQGVPGAGVLETVPPTPGTPASPVVPVESVAVPSQESTNVQEKAQASAPVPEPASEPAAYKGKRYEIGPSLRGIVTLIDPETRTGVRVPESEIKPEQPPSPRTTTRAAGEESEPKSNLPEEIGVKQADQQKVRNALGIGGLPSKQRISDEETLIRANEQKIPERATSIAASVIAHPRALTIEESMGLGLREAQIANEIEGLMGRIEKSKDDAEIKSMAAEMNRAEQDLLLLSEALDLSGSERGRQLRAQRMVLTRDMRLGSVIARAVAAKGSTLSKGEVALVTRLVEAFEQAQAKAESKQIEVADLIAERAVRKTKARQPRADRDVEALYARARDLLKAGCG